MEPELLFFDTFIHERNEDVNLDLVQFPHPVSITEVRIIPLGSKIEGDFPGGSRMGATNPSSFTLELYVNNLAKPASCVFDHLGSLQYDQNSNISVDFLIKNFVDGLVISGKYSIVTLAVYGKEVPTYAESEPPVVSSTTQMVESEQEQVMVATVEQLPAEEVAETEASVDLVEKAHERNYRKHAMESEEEENRNIQTDVSVRLPTATLPLSSADFQSKSFEGVLTSEISKEVVQNVRDEEITQEPIQRLQDTPEVEDIEQEDLEEILSDEDVMDDFDYQDGENEVPDFGEEFFKTFTPESFEIKKYQFLADPSETRYMTLLRQLPHLNSEDYQKIKANGEKLQEILLELSSSNGIGEKFVNAVEEVARLLPDALVCLESEASNQGGNMTSENAERTLFHWLNWSLDFSKAMEEPQPILKVRHIKAGLKLARIMTSCSERLQQKVLKGNLFGKLLSIFSSEYMAISLKLACLQAIDCAISATYGLEYFLKSPHHEELHLLLLEKQSSRVKAAIAQILMKISFFEAVSCLRRHVLEVIPFVSGVDKNKLEEIILCLGEIVKVLSNPKVFVGQHMRFLPAQVQIDIPETDDNWSGLYSILKTHKFLHSILILLVHPGLAFDGKLSSLVETVLEMLIDTDIGLRFLGSDPEVSTLILKQLLRVYDQVKSEEYGQDDPQVDMSTSLKLGNMMAYRLYVLQSLDVIFTLQKTFSSDMDNINLVSAIQNIQNLFFTPLGKLAAISVLSMNDNIKPILNFARVSEEIEEENLLKNLATRGYAISLTEIVTKYSQSIEFYKNHTEAIIEIAKRDESGRLSSLIPWLELPMKKELLSTNGLRELISVVKSNEIDCINHPVKLIMAVKIVASLVLPSKPTSSGDYTELKHSYSAVQLYSADTLTSFFTILAKWVEYYNQPSWHTPTLSGTQGVYLVSVAYPILQMLHSILRDVIRCRNTEFQDLTHVSLLLSVYELLGAVPSSCFMQQSAQQGCNVIIQILLAYTTPIIEIDADSAEDLLVKSLWTKMIREIFKFVQNGMPSNCITGLQVLSELLPLPLPITASPEEITEEFNIEQVNARKLWAAHLHSLVPQFTDILETLTCTVYNPLQYLLRRTAVQFADLTPSTALAVLKTLLDSLIRQVDACTKEEGAVRISNSFITDEEPNLSSLLSSDLSKILPKIPVLSILSYVTSFPCGKSAFLHLIQAQKDDKYEGILELCLALLSNIPRKHIQMHENLLMILQFLADAEICMTPVLGDETGLGNALPNRDSLVVIVNGLLDYIEKCDGQFQMIPSAFRIISYLCERNQTFSLIVRLLRERPTVLPNFVRLLDANLSQDVSDTIQSLAVFVELLRLFYRPTVHTDPEMIPSRNFFLPVWEVADLCGGLLPGSSLIDLYTKLSNLGDDLAPLKILLKQLLEDLQKPRGSDQLVELPEYNVPQADPLGSQWLTRVVVTQMSTPAQGIVDEEKLIGPAWIGAQLGEEADVEMEQEKCDVLEMTKNLLPDWNFVSEVEQVCRVEETSFLPGISTPKQETVDGRISPRSEEKTTPILSSMDAQRRPFIAPMRGRGYNRGLNTRNDAFRLRPSNTSRPPSLHVDDFVAMETSSSSTYGKDQRNRRPPRGGFGIDKPRFGGDSQFRTRGSLRGGISRSSGTPSSQRVSGYSGSFRGSFNDRRGRIRHWADDRTGRDRRDRGGYGARNFQR
ncbi:protein virilizer homolog [Artemia franciscana]|uniref:Virilizer N-terminal domain-containing protein n=2 Tax=Artemia franciscana TaxID=6661 RepID=A0AA88I5P5_ARTSF|nr:hypothetical protein QYM36_001812 [Artemia franciscana]